MNENMQKFLNFLAEDKERQDKANSFKGDFDALSAYARESGFEISAQDLLELKESSNKLLEARLQRVQQPVLPQSPGVKAFFDLSRLAETDESIAKRLEEIGTDATDELIAYGAEKGFIFTAQDLADIGKEILAPSEELSDEELELVAGGTSLLVALAFFAASVGVAVAVGAGVGVGFGAAAGGAAVGVLAAVKWLFK